MSTKKKKDNSPFEVSTEKFADTGVTLSNESTREAIIAIGKAKERRGHEKRERIARRLNSKRIGARRSTSSGKKLDGRGRSSGGTATGGSIASPLSETGREEEERTVISDDGLFEVTVAVVTQLTFNDANGSEVVFNLTPPTS